ncbi:hypothetical protein FJ959_18240 [Mesorhizobium sp. B2-2-4]|nr:hypothetical protein FJ959_18240 [Mesorhizobium sp. B2-2-4]TPM66392.1 hypothetical protein FJ965_14200 [Mesorhizobium sp. B2-2-1]TPN60617.1 hypothetical protein FJ984_30580 [Mesorhizobium sp. B1-1-3]
MTMWIRFTADFDWKPSAQSTIAYKAGTVLNVPRACAEAALGAAKAIKAGKAGKENGDGAQA